MGKTHWSTPLAESLAIPRIDFDDVIGKSAAIQKLTNGIEGKDEAEKMGKYFGMPWTKGFEEREQIFSEAEAAVMNDNASASNSVLDLTGSAFLHEDAMKKIAASGLVIYLEASPEAQEKSLADLVQGFKEGPKPVCWGSVPKPKSESALEASFADLLSYRAENYAQYADVTVPFDIHKNARSINEFIDYVRNQLNSEPKIIQPRQKI